MQHKTQSFSNFSRAIHTRSRTARPDHEEQLQSIDLTQYPAGVLARGNGLSYGDCCVLNQGTVIDTTRLNHILSFDPESGIAVCQGSVTFADLFLIDSDFIPAIIPGTLYATIAGGLANDVHGKNNHQAGSFGHHVEWLELNINGQTHYCSQNENQTLYTASIAGLGLTGIITRMGIRLRRASRFVHSHTEKFENLDLLLARMQQTGIKHDYQVAWLDLLNKPRALLSLADHVDHSGKTNFKHTITIPKLPLRLINGRIMKTFNRMHYHQADLRAHICPLWTFNNPLDRIQHWNRLYGKRGLVQFQAVFQANDSEKIIHALLTCIHAHKATPTLAVLKYFTKAGSGLLSFATPGFTVAIDFIHNQAARNAIKQMNQCIAEWGGKVYLAKDLYLNQAQYEQMYPQHEAFRDIINQHNSPMRSDLSARLGISR
jgi:decaprenylphospho-beta-D-ribofuranose 2-oxidase